MEKGKWAGRIRAFRKLKGYTQQELADKMDVSISILGSIERGTRKLDSRIIRLISTALDVDPDELVPKSQERKSV